MRTLKYTEEHTYLNKLKLLTGKNGELLANNKRNRGFKTYKDFYNHTIAELEFVEYARDFIACYEDDEILMMLNAENEIAFFKNLKSKQGFTRFITALYSDVYRQKTIKNAKKVIEVIKKSI